ncbi:hypothetical protein L6452_26558 [Arctium lappa]|uniref:Uncharacterized protein n=1 Tax=Arctium lappa TaxID=4217 RepID=A0ACB8ZUT3_ARCLA|nr:hypothetical protein L6452_26558 [Arctium lappa]
MMMGASNLMMGLTLVLVICLAVVLGLVLVLLAELYCSVLLRRRQPPPTTTTTTTEDHLTTINTTTTTTLPPPPSLNNFYAHGVLSAPRNILYPTISGASAGDIEKQQQLPQPPENQENGCLRKGCSGKYSGRMEDEGLVYISNPVYDDGENGRRRSRAAGNGATPFETPETSPSRLETEGSSGGDDDDDEREGVSSGKVVVTPPLTPMKKLPAAVKDGGGGGGGDLNEVSSSSSSETLSLSW